MIKLVFSFLFLLISVSSYTQKIDSLYLSDLSKKIILLKKGKKLDSAINQSNLLLAKAKSINNQYFELKAYDRLAKYNRQNNSPFQAVRFYFKSKELNLKLGDTFKAIDKLRFIASIQKTLGDFNSSENTTVHALLLSKSLPDSLRNKHKLGIYNHLGITTNRQNNYLDAIKWYHKALELTKDTLKILGIENNIALASIRLGNYSSAINSLNTIIKLPILKKNKNLKARIVDNLAFAKSKLNYPEAEEELLIGLGIRKEINDLPGQFASNIRLTEHYQDRNQNKKGLIYANQAYQIAGKLKSPTSKVEALSYLIDLKNNPSTEAIEFKKLTDSIYTARDKAKNQFAKIRYETEENRRKILTLKAEKAEQQLIVEKQKAQNIIYLGLGILTLLSSIYLFFYLRTKYKKEKLQEIYKTETRISKKVHDELANDVYQVMTQLQTKNNTDTTPILDQLEDIYSRTRDISRENNRIETGAQYTDELRSMVSRYGSDQTNIIINGLTEEHWINIPALKKIETYRVLQELMTNMKKHSKASLVALTFRKEDNKIHITYTDNGIGFSEIQQNIANGIHNVENRINAIDGSIIFDTNTEKGLKANISFLA